MVALAQGCPMTAFLVELSVCQVGSGQEWESPSQLVEKAGMTSPWVPESPDPWQDV